MITDGIQIYINTVKSHITQLFDALQVLQMQRSPHEHKANWNATFVLLALLCNFWEVYNNSQYGL